MQRSAEFSVHVTRRPGALVVAPQGEIDVATVERVRAACAAHERGTLALDLREVGFLDSSGLRLVVECQRRADACGHRFVVVRGRGSVQRLFEVVGLGHRLTVVDEPAEALADADLGP